MDNWNISLNRYEPLLPGIGSFQTSVDLDQLASDEAS